VIDEKTELNLDFDSAPRKFIDVESGEIINLCADNVKQEYQEKDVKYFKDIALTCVQNKIKYVPVNVGANFNINHLFN
jgi:hypothetical protein